MAKTTNSIGGRRGNISAVVSAAMVSALSGLTTAETIDLSSVSVAMEEVSAAVREVDEDYVLGDASPIITADDVLSSREFRMDFYYTQGSETLGTDTLDPYAMYKEVHEHTAALSFQHTWGIGATPAETFTTSATETFIMEVTTPVPTGERNKVRFSVRFRTTSIAVA